MKCLAHITDNPDGHDWVLVPDPQPFYTVMESNKLLWACPCSEFKWTSYAEWEMRQGGGVENSTTVTWGGDNNSPAPRA